MLILRQMKVVLKYNEYHHENKHGNKNVDKNENAIRMEIK